MALGIGLLVLCGPANALEEDGWNQAKATELAAEALSTGRGIIELIREKGILENAQIEQILDARFMTGR